jgi:glycopeptide antibiotics resistance protein
MCQYVVVEYTMKHHKYRWVSSCSVHDDTVTYVWYFIVYSTTRYWHIFLMFNRVLYNNILTHVFDVSLCTLQQDTHTYFWCFILYSTTRYWHIFLMFHRVLEYTIKHQKYVSISSCTVHDEISDICDSVWLYSTRWSIINMWRYLVVQCTMKHQKYGSCTVQPDTVTYVWCFIVYSTTRYWHIFLMFHRVVYNSMRTHISDVSSCTLQLDTDTVSVSNCRIYDETSEICVSI